MSPIDSDEERDREEYRAFIREIAITTLITIACFCVVFFVMFSPVVEMLWRTFR